MTHGVIQGNCLEVMRNMRKDSVDHVFTSPPYNRKRNDKYAHYDDTIPDYYQMLLEFTDEALRLSKRHVFVNLQKNYYNKTDVLKYLGNYAEEIVEIIVWEKTNPLPASGKSITNAYELFVVLGKSALKSSTTYTKNHITTSVNGKMPEGHKAVMKPEVAEWFIEKFTNEGETILDPFAGTGTTKRACEKLGRNSISIEIIPEYASLI